MRTEAILALPTNALRLWLVSIDASLPDETTTLQADSSVFNDYAEKANVSDFAQTSQIAVDSRLRLLYYLTQPLLSEVASWRLIPSDSRGEGPKAWMRS